MTPPAAVPAEPAATPVVALEPVNEAATSPERLPVAERPPSSPNAVRPLAGFSLGAPYEDDDGERGGYAGLSDREPETSSEPASERAAPPSGALGPHASAPDLRRATREPADAPRTRPALRDPLLDREWRVPQASEFQPAARGGVALHAPERSTRPSAARNDPSDPYPGFSDEDGAPGPARRTPGREPAPRSDDQPAPRLPVPAAASVSSCESALASANEEMDFTKKQSTAPDVTAGAYAAILQRGGYLVPCGVPAGMSLDVCAAVRDGHAVGITVVTRPADARVRGCVRNAVAGLAFPRSPRLDVTRTRFDSSRAR
jgi:hypothetical protein